MLRIFLTAALVAAALHTAVTATARPRYSHNPVPPLAVMGPAKPISAWTTMCKAYEGECTFNASEPERIVLTPDTRALVAKVNRTVNAVIVPVEDEAHWGIPDKWDFAEDGKGDCEDYQLVKRRLLIGLGIPRRALRMTVVIDEIGAGHAVLMLRTTDGEFILDNKRNAVLAWDRTGYTYIKRESSYAPGEWVTLSSDPVEFTGNAP